MFGSIEEGLKVLKLFLLILLLFLGVSFALLNPALVKVNYYFGALEGPMSFVVVTSLGLGMVLGMTVSGFLFLKLRTQLYLLQKRANLAEQEVENLRKVPLQNAVSGE